MKNLFRKKHLSIILNLQKTSLLPVDKLLQKYFSSHRSIGSKDRKALAEAVYRFIRWRELIEFFLSQGQPGGDTTTEEYLDEKRLEILLDPIFDITSLQQTDVPDYIAAGMPKWLFELLKDQMGFDSALHFCQISNTQAPTTVRVNEKKISRTALLKTLSPELSVVPCRESSIGMIFLKKPHFNSMKEFKEGFFEPQDEACQLATELISPSPGDRILDFCAGAGGKTLAVAARSASSCSFYLHDIRPSSLTQAKIRLKRAGVNRFQIIPPSDTSSLEALKRGCDWVIADVPCSATGTLRRNPDQKWRLSPVALQKLIAKQRHIFKDALQYVRPGAKIIYMTCSSLDAENKNQVLYFCKNFSVTLENTFECLPEKGGKDGFFAALFLTH